MERTQASPDQFITSLPEGVREDMEGLDRLISGAMAGQERVLWEGVFWGGTQQRIIGYGSMRYVGRSGASGEWFLVGLARQKDYYSLYVNVMDAEGAILPRFANRLGKVKATKSNITFKRASDLDLDALRELLDKVRATTTSR
jgi:hypothetical protein